MTKRNKELSFRKLNRLRFRLYLYEGSDYEKIGNAKVIIDNFYKTNKPSCKDVYNRLLKLNSNKNLLSDIKTPFISGILVSGILVGLFNYFKKQPIHAFNAFMTAEEIVRNNLKQEELKQIMLPLMQLKSLVVFSISAFIIVCIIVLFSIYLILSEVYSMNTNYKVIKDYEIELIKNKYVKQDVEFFKDLINNGIIEINNTN